MIDVITKAIWLFNTIGAQKIFFVEYNGDKFWKYIGAIIFILGSIILIFN